MIDSKMFNIKFKNEYKGTISFGDLITEEEHNRRPNRIHEQAQMDRGMARHAYGMQVPFPQLVRDTDSSSCSDTLCQHKRQITHLIRYMVRRQSLLAETSLSFHEEPQIIVSKLHGF